MIKDNLKNFFRIFGYEVKRFPSGFSRRRIELLMSNQIGLVFDVGANSGSYAELLRSSGYKNKIISFEPLSKVFKDLKSASEGDPKWNIKNIAVGNMDGTVNLNIAGNSFSSSILEMGNSHKSAAPHSAYIDSETVEIRKIDSIFDECAKNESKNIFLKLDVHLY